MKGILVSILRDRTDCTNGGVTSPARAARQQAILSGPGLPQLFDPSPDMPELMLVPGLGGQKWRAIPAEAKPAGNLGWMFGGNFVFTSDSRFARVSDGPIPVHDRSESQELYDLLST